MTTPSVEQLLDVRELEPCEPLERALEECDRLGPGQYLRMLHRREPFLLYPILEQRGFGWHTTCADDESYDIFVWHRDDKVAEQNCNTRRLADRSAP